MTAPSWLSKLAARLGVPVDTPPRDRAGVAEKLRALQVARADARLFDDHALKMMEGALRIADLRIRDVMISKSDWAAVRESHSYDAVLKTVREVRHSRYPVLDDSGEKVVGVLLAKDLLNHADAPESFSLKSAMRPPVFEPTSKPLNFLLDEFQRRREHMVVALDEDGMPAGIVTIEDVLERIVGDIEDESDSQEEKIFIPLDANSAQVRGGASLQLFNERFGANLDGGADTVAGWMAAELGHIPKVGEIVRAGDITLEAVKADERAARILVARRPSQGRRGGEPGTS